MNLERTVRRLNERLGSELGRNERNEPVYSWMWSEDSKLMHPMRVPGEYDYKASPMGIIEALPVYNVRKLCLTANAQWVLVHWIPSPSEDEWRSIFGYWLEWPKGGQYYPTNVALDPGVEPDDTITQVAIDCIKQTLAKSAAQVERETAEALDRQEAAEKNRTYEEIRDACTTYDHVPGTKGAVSYPAPETTTK